MHQEDVAIRRIIHTSKKHMVQGIVAMCLAILVMIFCNVGAIIFLHKNRITIGETSFNPSKMNAVIRPQGEKMADIIIPTNQDELIDLAVELIEIANYNIQHDSKVAFAVNTKTSVLGMDTGGIRYYVKNDEEYFQADYFYVPQCGSNQIIIAAAAENTNYGYRAYYNLSKYIGREQKAKKLSYEIDSNASILFGVCWDVLYFDNSLTQIPELMAESGEEYFYYNYIVNKDTVLSATVVHIDDYYEIVVDLDCSKNETTIHGIKYLTDATGDSGARYTQIVQKIQIWDNGRFKMYNSADTWLSPKAYGVFLNLSSTNDYRTTFYYDDYSLDIDNYQYATEFKESVLSQN